MTKSLLTLFFCFIVVLTNGQASLDGTYIGVEEKCYVGKDGKKDCYNDPSRPKWKWYNLSKMKIKRDSVFLDQSPIAIYKKDTTFSASDGGFYYYGGKLAKVDTVLNIQLTELYCDYCGVQVKRLPDGTTQVVKRTKKWTAKITDKGIVINGCLFRRISMEEDLVSEHPRTSE
jgi:hypothetical protein